MKDVLTRIAWKNHKNGALNPRAQFRKEVAKETIACSPLVAGHLGIFDCSGVSDGSAAAIIVRAEDAHRYTDQPLYVKALSFVAGPGGRAHRPRLRLHDASPRSCARPRTPTRQAGITDPRAELAMAEVHDCFTPTELVLMEDLGFAERGHGVEGGARRHVRPRRRAAGQSRRRPEVASATRSAPPGCACCSSAGCSSAARPGERQIASVGRAASLGPHPQPRRRARARACRSSASSAPSAATDRPRAGERATLRARPVNLDIAEGIMELLIGTAQGIFRADAHGHTKPGAGVEPRSVRHLCRCERPRARGDQRGRRPLERRRGRPGRRAASPARSSGTSRPPPTIRTPSTPSPSRRALFRSRDGGRSWEEIASFRKAPGVEEWCLPRTEIAGRARTILVDPTNPARWLVGVEVGGVYETRDAGETWTFVRPGGNPDIHVMVRHPERPALVFASTGFGRPVNDPQPMDKRVAGVFRSSDGGTTWAYAWQDMRPPYTRPLCVDPRAPARGDGGLRAHSLLEPAGPGRCPGGGLPAR